MSIVTEEMRYRQRLCEYAIKYVLTIKISQQQKIAKVKSKSRKN